MRNRMSTSIRFATAVLAGLIAGGAVAGERMQIADSRLDELDELLARNPDDFAGLSVDHETQHVTIRVVEGRDRNSIQHLLATLPPDPAEESDTPQWTVVLKPVPRSARSLEAVQSQVMTREPCARLVKPVLAQIHIDVERNVVAVGVTRITPELQRAALRTFGPAVELYVTERHTAFTRAWPSANGAMTGGAIIRMSDGNHCASGWPVRFNGGGWTGFTTAGHCVVNVGAMTAVSDEANTYLGSTVAYHLSGSGTNNLGMSWTQDTDAAVFSDINFSSPLSSEPRVYVGGADSNTRSYVVGSRNVRVGDRVCFGGPFTGENCTAVVQSVNATAVIYVGGLIGFPITGLIEARSSDGSSIAQPGDSGAPVYIKGAIGFNTVVTAVGAIEAGPEHAPASVAMFVPISKVIPTGASLWTATCSLFSCTF